MEPDLRRELRKQCERAINGPFSKIRYSSYVVGNLWDRCHVLSELDTDVWTNRGRQHSVYAHELLPLTSNWRIIDWSFVGREGSFTLSRLPMRLGTYGSKVSDSNKRLDVARLDLAKWGLKQRVQNSGVFKSRL
jgi:hypothetical protein